MARRSTRFERDLADLHGDADVEIVELQPAAAPRRYRVVSQPKGFMDGFPPIARFAGGLLGVVISLAMLIASLVAAGAALYLLWALFFGA